MKDFEVRFQNWQRSQVALDTERERTAYLNDTARIPQNPPGLFTPVHCKVIKAFYIQGKPTMPDEVVSLPWHVAQDMFALGKVEIIE